MAKKPDKRQQAYTMWVQGTPITKIAARLKVHRTTVQSWKKADKWDELKDSIPEPPQETRRPKLVSFDGHQRSQRERASVNLSKVDYDSIEGRLQAIDELLDATREEILKPTSPQQYSAAVGGFNKLLESRDRAKPIDRFEFMKLLMQRYRTEDEFLADYDAIGLGKQKTA